MGQEDKNIKWKETPKIMREGKNLYGVQRCVMKNSVVCFMFLKEVYRAYIIIILLFIGSMMNGYAVSKPINETLDQIDDKSNSFVVYSGDGYSISYPDKWRVVHNPDPISDVYIGDSMGHIGFTVLYFETSQSVAELNKTVNGNAMQTGMKISENEPVTLKGMEGYKTIYLFPMGGINQTHISYLFKKGNIVYNIKFGGQSRYMDSNAGLIDRIIQTIKIE